MGSPRARPTVSSPPWQPPGRSHRGSDPRPPQASDSPEGNNSPRAGPRLRKSPPTAAPTRSGPRRGAAFRPGPPRRGGSGAFPLPPPARGAGRWRRAAAAFLSPQRRHYPWPRSRPPRRRHLQRPRSPQGRRLSPAPRAEPLPSAGFCPFYTGCRRRGGECHKAGSPPVALRERRAPLLSPVRGQGEPGGGGLLILVCLGFFYPLSISTQAVGTASTRWVVLGHAPSPRACFLHQNKTGLGPSPALPCHRPATQPPASLPVGRAAARSVPKYSTRGPET